MLEKSKGKLTYSNVVSTLCLFLLLGGGAYAATQLPKNSVGSKQLRKNSVNSAKVKDHSLLGVDFRAGQLPAGPRGKEGPRGRQGPRGAKGDTGPQGLPGVAGATNALVRYGPEIELQPSSGFYSNAECHSGEAVTGGGFQFVGGGGRPENNSYFITQDRPSVVEEDFPVTPADGTKATGWMVAMENDTAAAFGFRSYAMCASP